MLFKIALPVVAVFGLLLATTRKAQASEVQDVTNNLSDIFPSLRGSEDVNKITQTVDNIYADSPRGIRNNNPGNLVMTTIAWKGKVPASKNTDRRYEQFESAVYGIRAMFMDVRGDIEKDGKNTITKLITEYAPKFENNTAAYIASVSQQIGLGAGELIKPTHYFALLKAIIKHENGVQPYSDAMIKEAMALA